MLLKKIQIAKLRPAPYNPKIRTEKKQLSGLLTSISTNGLLMPIIIDTKMNIIDGHRRVACYKLLEIDTIQAIISDSKLSKDESYEQINILQRKMNSSEMIYVYVNKGKVPKKVEEKIKILERIIGFAMLKQLGEKGVAVAILQSANQAGKYLNDTSDQMIKKIISWAIKNKQTYAIRKAIEDGISKTVLKNAIIQNRPIKRDWK